MKVTNRFNFRREIRSNPTVNRNCEQRNVYFHKPSRFHHPKHGYVNVLFPLCLIMRGRCFICGLSNGRVNLLQYSNLFRLLLVRVLYNTSWSCFPRFILHKKAFIVYKIALHFKALISLLYLFNLFSKQIKIYL